MGKLDRITAEEARKITETSTFMLSQVYKWIKSAAKQNYVRTPFSMLDIDSGVLENIINTLREDGYTVTLIEEEHSKWYEITW